MHGWLQQPREPGDQDAPLVPSLVAEERGNRSRLGKGRKQASEQGPEDGAQRQQKCHKAAEDAEGGSQSQLVDPPPHLPLPEREPRSGTSAPPFRFTPPNPGGHGSSPRHSPPRHRPGTGKGWDARSGTPTPRGGRDGWMDGWCENSGGNSLGHGPKAPISPSPCQKRFLSSGLANPRNLGSCTTKLMIWLLQAPPDCRRTLERSNHQAPWVPRGIQEG